MLKQILLSGALALPIVALNANAQQKPASVFITAGQSNADGRVYNSEIVDYLKPGYKYLKYANVTSQSSGTFTTRNFDNAKERWAFCDVTNYFIEQALQQDFYAIKCTYGGTAIATGVTAEKLPVWYADPTWIAENNAYRGDITKGKSLTKSLTEGFSDLVDGTLSKLQQGYDVKAIMWHQGESDRNAAGAYYTNFKTMIQYMRNAIYQKTGDEKDKTLPFIFGTITSDSKQYSAKVKEAQLQVANDLENVYVIDMEGVTLRSDQLHFDKASTEYLGKMMYNKLVALGLVEGNEVEATKPTKPTGTEDVGKVEAERMWDFKVLKSQATEANLKADTKWEAKGSTGYRYTSALPTFWEPVVNNTTIEETKGLYFKSPSGNRLYIKPGNHICLYADNLKMTIPKVKPLQYITIVTKSAKGERGITPDADSSSDTNLMLIKGGTKSADLVTNCWQVSDEIKDETDIVFHSNGGAIYVYSIMVSNEDPSNPTSIKRPKKQSPDTAWVNLQGIKTQDPTNGIYIQNGKKYLVSK